MENKKTKLGVSVGLMGAALYFTMFFGGYTPFFLLAAWVFLREENEWLKKIAVKALALSICFALITAAANLIPDAISVVNKLTGIFRRDFSIPFISNIIYLFTSVVSFAKTVVFLISGIQAVSMNEFHIGFIDKIAEDGTAAVEKAVKTAAPAVTEEPKAEEKAETSEEK